MFSPVKKNPECSSAITTMLSTRTLIIVLLGVITLAKSIDASTVPPTPSTTMSTSSNPSSEATTLADSNSNITTSPMPLLTTQENKVTSPKWNTSVLCKHLANLTAPAPPVKEEPIEANCFPGFVCVNGFCTGGMSCKCHEGWAGLFCQSECPKDCAPYGKCVTSTGNNAICVCNETSIYEPGQGCVDKPPESNETTTMAPTTTIANLRPKSERECFGNVVCVYGYCDIGIIKCICDDGWRGQSCYTPCDLDCNGHGRCRENEQYMMYCMCDASHSGENCEISLYNETTTAATISTAKSNITGDNSVGGSSFQKQHEKPGMDLPSADPMGAQTSPDLWFVQNLDNFQDSGKSGPSSTDTGNKGQSVTGSNATGLITTMRPISERECLDDMGQGTGFVCQHGYCSLAQDTLSCVCDPGWGGVFCSEYCNLYCGLNGTCVFTDFDMDCKCDEGLTGIPCRPPGEGNNESIANTTQTPETGPISFPMVDMWEPMPERPLQPLALRYCQQGFVCRYGNCSVEGDTIECKCEPEFTDVFCDKLCTLDCGEHGKCEINHMNGTEECYCVDPRYTGYNCSILLDFGNGEGSENSKWAIGTSIAAVLLLLLLLVILLFVLWKRRNITLMKIVYWFQPFEEDDDREYDGFVSYASADLDRQFVIQTLVPRLEGRMCFTLCIHQRNFVPGLYITDNITDSVKKSRRTLLIISPSFINSGWCKFEYQMALQEMLNQKHRILPILLGDVSDLKEEMDDTLQSILKAVTWLEYPGKDADEQEHEKFWKRLALSMPKKRPTQLESVRSQSCLTTPTSVTSQSNPITPSSSEPASPSGKKTPPLELRFFPKANSKELPLPLKQIVRVPASDLESDQNKSKPSLFSMLSNLLGRSGSGDSTGSSSCAPLDPYSNPAPNDNIDGLMGPYSNSMGQNGYQDGYSPQDPSNNQVSNGNRQNTAPSLMDNFLGDQSLGGPVRDY